MDTQSVAAADAVKRLSSGSLNPLCFGAVDGFAYAAQRRRPFGASKVFTTSELGPLMELIHLSDDGSIPPLNDARWLHLANAEEFYSAIRQGCPLWIIRKGGTRVSQRFEQRLLASNFPYPIAE
jgi:hypothetical protein